MILGRLPGSTTLGWPSIITKLCARCVSGIPVSPAITEGIQAPEGVAENIMPSLSMILTEVVSFDISASDRTSTNGIAAMAMMERRCMIWCGGV